MRACSGATGIPLDCLRMAKAQGCPAFRGTRVHLDDFLRWWFDPARPRNGEGTTQDGAVNWLQERAKVQTQRERLKLEQDRGRLLEAHVVASAIAKGLSALFDALDRRFGSEFPARCKGLDEVGIRDIAIEAIEDMKDELRETLEGGQW